LFFYCVFGTVYNKGVNSSEQIYMPTEQLFKLHYSPWDEMISFKKEISISKVLDVLFKRE